MKFRYPAALLPALCLSIVLCACADGTKAPESTQMPQPSVSPAAVSSGEEAAESTMRMMELTPQERFYLDALSTNIFGKHVYEIRLAEDYSQFSAQVYRLVDGAWVKKGYLSYEIMGDTCYFAVSEELDQFTAAFKTDAGSESRSTSTHSDGEGSAFGSASHDVRVQEALTISEKEIPLIAYRRFDMEGEHKLASLEDFYAPEDVDAGEIEEYYILTVAFRKEA